MPRFLAACILFAAATPSLADSADAILCPPSSEVAAKLQQRVTVQWQNVPLRQALNRLSQSQRLCIWIDRRVDPSQEVTLTMRDVPLAKLIEEVVQQIEGGFVATGDLLYVGPPDIVRDLRTLLAIRRTEIEQLPRATQARLLRRNNTGLPRLTDSRAVVRQLTEAAGVALENPAALPHDLWPALQLTTMAVADQLSIVLAGFDLAWELDDAGRTMTIVPIERPVILRRLYSQEQIAKLPAEHLQGVEIVAGRNRDQVGIAARAETHELLSGRPRSNGKRRQKADRQVFSLRVEQQPVGKIVEQIAAQLGKQVELRMEAKSAFDKRVSFDVREATLDALLEAACRPAGLQAEIDGDVVRIAPRTN